MITLFFTNNIVVLIMALFVLCRYFVN